MFKNYLIIALRNLNRQKSFSAINILGLAIGLGTCFLIVLYIQDELSFDAWHAKGDRIYRVIRETKSGGAIGLFAIYVGCSGAGTCAGLSRGGKSRARDNVVVRRCAFGRKKSSRWVSVLPIPSCLKFSIFHLCTAISKPHFPIQMRLP